MAPLETPTTAAEPTAKPAAKGPAKPRAKRAAKPAASIRTASGKTKPGRARKVDL